MDGPAPLGAEPRGSGRAVPAAAWYLLGGMLLPFAAFQTVVPLFAWLAPVLLLRGVRRTGGAVRALSAVFVVHLVAALIGFRGGYLPMEGLAGVLAPAAGVAALFACAYAADRAFVARLGPVAGSLVFPATAVGLIWLATEVGGSYFPSIVTPGYSQAGFPAVAQLASVLGVPGVSFLLLWAAPLVDMATRGGWSSRVPRRTLLVYGLLIATVVVAGSFRSATATGTTVRVAAVVADEEFRSLTVDWDDRSLSRGTRAERSDYTEQLTPLVDDLVAKTVAAARDGARIVVWPETAVIAPEEHLRRLSDRLAAVAADRDIYLHAGIGVSELSTGPHYLQNRALLFTPKGTTGWNYLKTYGVPADPANDGGGSGALPMLDTPYGRLTGAICYDLDYPAHMRQAGRMGADIMLVPAEDWEGFRSAHPSFAAFRAIENGASMVRSANDGQPTITDGYGRVLARSDTFTDDYPSIAASVPVDGARTPYPYLGDVLPIACLVGLAGLVGWAAWSTIRTRT